MEKLKKIDLRTTIRAFSIIWMLVLIVVMTITNVGIDENFNWIKWLGNSMILFGITVYGLLIGESTGVDIQKGRIVHDESNEIIGGLYQKNLHEYNAFRKTIDDIHIYFCAFYDWFVPQRIETKNIEFLIMGGMNSVKARNIVKYCSIENLWELKEHAIDIKTEDGKIINIRKLQEDEIEPVEMVLKGKVQFKQSGTAYYLQAFAESNQKDIMEEGEGYKEARLKNKHGNRIIRIVSGLFISLALGLLTVNDFMKGSDAQAWMNLITRITNLITALFSGYMSGVVDVKLQAEAIANKTDVLKMFKSAYDKRMFPIEDEDALARKEVEKYKKEVEQANENVIEPENVIIPMPIVIKE